MERRQPFISRVRLTNYKSIASCDVRLGPLTILIGPNGSGKSNFLDALAFLSRAIETTPNQAIDERGGLDAILRSVPAPADSFRVEVEVTLPWDEGLSAHGNYGFEVAQNDSKGRFSILAEACSLETPNRSVHSKLTKVWCSSFREIRRSLRRR
jgi:predicted ATPase